jgi:hypothetical protein
MESQQVQSSEEFNPEEFYDDRGRFWDMIGEDDKRYLTTTHSCHPCPWCGGIVSAMALSKTVPTILDAWVEGEELVLLSARFERLPVPLKKLENYIGKSKTKVRQFEIDEDGRFLFWPHADAHLGWEQMMQIVDPTTAVAAKKKTGDFNRKYGAAIRSLREEAELTQAAITGLTERHLRRIEQGKQAATSTALKSLAKAHGMSIDEYMKELATRT